MTGAFSATEDTTTVELGGGCSTTDVGWTTEDGRPPVEPGTLFSVVLGCAGGTTSELVGWITGWRIPPVDPTFCAEDDEGATMGLGGASGVEDGGTII